MICRLASINPPASSRFAFRPSLGPQTGAPFTGLRPSGEKTNTSSPAEIRPASPTSKTNPAQAPRQSPETRFAENIAAKSRVASEWCAARPIAARAPSKNLPLTPPLPLFPRNPMKQKMLHAKKPISPSETKDISFQIGSQLLRRFGCWFPARGRSLRFAQRRSQAADSRHIFHLLDKAPIAGVSRSQRSPIT